jgi:hypothetical protein
VAVRLEIELTSSRDDGTWTWRAAGAKQPKGVLDGSLLTAGAKVGDVLRADAEQNIDGINVTAVLPPKTKSREPDRLELIAKPEGPLVISNVAPRDDKPDSRRGRGEGRRPGERTRRPSDRPARNGGREGGREGRREGGGRESGGRDRGRRDAGPDGVPRRGGPRPAPAATEERPPRARPKRLNAGRTHRDALVAALAPEEVPIAEQLLKGGIAGVRQAIQAQIEKARAAGDPKISAEPLLALAEELLPRVKAAEWRDRAEAAVAQADEVGLRDLRAVVAGADSVARDTESRELAAKLRDALDRRSAAERQEWTEEVTSALDEGRVVRALRISGRPPEAGARFPAELAGRLSEAAGAALGPDVAPDRWAAVLEAVAASPVRTAVKPAGLPSEPGEQLLTAARQAARRVPALGALLGIETERPARLSRPPSSKRPVPPPPKAAAPPSPTPAPTPEPPPEPVAEAEPASEPVAEAEPASEPVAEAASEPESAEQW